MTPSPAKATKELAELVNAAINAGAEIAMIALDVDGATRARLFLNNLKFSQMRNQKRKELVERVKGKAK